MAFLDMRRQRGAMCSGLAAEGHDEVGPREQGIGWGKAFPLRDIDDLTHRGERARITPCVNGGRTGFYPVVAEAIGELRGDEAITGVTSTKKHDADFTFVHAVSVTQ